MNPLDHRIFTSVADLPENWDSLAGGNIFLTKAYFEVLERSAPTNMTCFFIGVFNGESLVGIAISQFLDLNDVTSFGVRDNCFKTKIRNFVFKRFGAHVLILGNNMLTGPNTLRMDKSISQKDGFAAMADALDSLRLLLGKKGLNVHLTIWKDFKSADPKDTIIPDINSYFKFSTQPNMVLDIRSHWQAEADYVADFSKKYRDQYKRARKKNDGVEKRKLSLEEIRANSDTIYDLYFNVARNAPFNTFWLAKNHFTTLKELLVDEFLFYGYFLDQKLIGFDTLIKNGSSMDTYFLGYDENCQREKMLYLNMLYNMIGYSIKKGFKKVIFARTALEIKSSVGAKPVDLYGYIRHSNSVVNKFMPKLFRYFEPEMAWQPRHPFKDEERQSSVPASKS
ncbi:MAG: GNAT family N-acetyltransferase [Flavobacterium sp.]|nr:MAG: GNAT family N-acetyltransferase [Flavobacterium sp.]